MVKHSQNDEHGFGEIIGILTTKFSHPLGIIPEGMSFAVPLHYVTPLLDNIPEFDFSAIGKARRETKTDDKNGDLVRKLARVTVRIETLRGDQPALALGPRREPRPRRPAPRLVHRVRRTIARRASPIPVLPHPGSGSLPRRSNSPRSSGRGRAAWSLPRSCC
ncbi:MAG: hypothetical protein NW703_02485 [Nitrospiraceae bacterium]